jgi:hypothetical protein
MMRFRDPGWKKVGFGIRDKHPGSATLSNRSCCDGQVREEEEETDGPMEQEPEQQQQQTARTKKTLNYEEYKKMSYLLIKYIKQKEEQGELEEASTGTTYVFCKHRWIGPWTRTSFEMSGDNRCLELYSDYTLTYKSGIICFLKGRGHEKELKYLDKSEQF